MLIMLSALALALRPAPLPYLLRPAPRHNGPLRAAPPVMTNLLETSELAPPPERVVAAVEAAKGARLTAADLAAQSGVSIDEARRGMRELATALAGCDGVSVSASEQGDLLYSFPADVRRELASRSAAAKARDAWNSAKPALQTAGRFAFGLALFASIAVVFTAITVLTSGGDERDDERDRGFGGGRERSLFGFGWGQISPFDILFPRPYGFYSYGWFAPPPRMTLPEAVFSFVFGDGDPNKAIGAARLRAMAEVIRSNSGAVTAESLAPFLDPPPAGTFAESYNVDESWVLPAVTELGGRPEVSGEGTIVYVFDELTVSGLASEASLVLADPALAAVRTLDAAELARLAQERAIPTQGADAGALRDALRSWAGEQLGGGGGGSLFPGGYLEERTAPFSNAEGGQLVAAGALGLLNLGGCAYLGSLLAQLPPGAQLPGELGAVQAVFPLLLAYAVSYVAIPAVRFARLQAENAAVAQRNANRRAWRDALRRGGSELQKRLEAASRRGKKLRLVSEEDVAFDSSKSLGEQPEQQTPALDDFDRRLRDATR